LQTVIVKEVSDDELSEAIFWLGASENCIKSEGDLLINPFEEVLFRRFGNQAENVAERIFLRANSIVRRNYYI
jgi:hypothetical protein